MIKVNSCMIQRRDTSNCGMCVAISQGYAREMTPIQKGGSLTMVTYIELIIQVRWVIEGLPPQGLKFNSLWCQFGWANSASLKKSPLQAIAHSRSGTLWLDSYNVHCFWTSTGRCVNKGSINWKIQPTYLQDVNDGYPFTNFKESVVNIIFVICTYYIVLVNFWEELSTSQV